MYISNPPATGRSVFPSEIRLHLILWSVLKSMLLFSYSLLQGAHELTLLQGTVTLESAQFGG